MAEDSASKMVHTLMGLFDDVIEIFGVETDVEFKGLYNYLNVI